MLAAPALRRASAAESAPHRVLGHSRSTASELPSANRLLAAPHTMATVLQAQNKPPPCGTNDAASSAAADAASEKFCSAYMLHAERRRSDLQGRLLSAQARLGTTCSQPQTA